MNKIHALSMPDYLSHKAYGASDLIKMARSFAYYKWRKANPEKPGRPLVIGSATHALLEAELSGKGIAGGKPGVVVYDDGSSLTKGFKAFQESNPTKYCVDADENALVARMVKALLDDSEVMGYLKDAVPEATIIGNYPGTRVECKVRPDYLHMKRGVSINLKTAADASESGFIHSAGEYGYDFQSALYCDMLTQEFGKSFDEVHILVEKGDSPEECQINIFTFGEDTLCHARTMLQALMERIPECEKSGIWPKKQTILQTLDLPLWKRKVVQP